MGKELISVIVPVYKVECYIEKCISSIINQSYSNLEIILIDDGSPDNCGRICDDFAKDDSRINVIHKKNEGLSQARNDGLDIAKGDYVTFVDSDDWLMVDFLKYLHGLVGLYSADMAAMPLCKVDERGDVLSNGMDGDISVFSDQDAIASMFSNKGIPWCAQGKLYKMELFHGIRFPKGMIMEDKGTTYKIFAKCQKIVFARKPYYMYLIRTGSIMHSNFSDAHLKAFNIQLELNDFIHNNYPECDNLARAYTGRVALIMMCKLISLSYDDDKVVYFWRFFMENSSSMIWDNNIDFRYRLLACVLKPYCLMFKEKSFHSKFMKLISDRVTYSVNNR